MRRCVCGGSAISGSSIAKITFTFSSAMNVSNENTIALMMPDPNRQYGTGVLERSELPKQCDRPPQTLSCQRGRVQPKRAVIRGQTDETAVPGGPLHRVSL